MSETTLTESKRKTTADYQRLVTQMFAEMNQIEEQMDKEHVTSARLESETQVIKAETEVIKARTVITLSQLTQQVNSLTRAM